MNNLTAMEMEITAYPNPFDSEITVIVTIDFSVIAILSLVNASGNVVRMLSWTLKKGENNLLISNLDKNPPGNYQLEVRLLNGELIKDIEMNKV